MTYNATPIFATKKRPLNGLLAFASLLPTGLDWKRGVRYVPEGCTPSETLGMCDPERGQVTRPASPGVSTFNPFRITIADACSDPWASDDELLGHAQRVNQMSQSAALARELTVSTVGNGSLSGDAADVTANTPTNWECASSALLYAMMNAGYVGDVWFHSPTWLEPALYGTNIGKAEDGTRRAYIGANPVIVDAGYSGLIGPGGGIGNAAPGEVGWVYATGPVEYAIGDLFDDIAVSTETRQNDKMILGERPAIVRFDTCQVFAALVEAC